ncbi:MAG: DUF3419 family protein [Alphaproteobacteria bacterium]|nr:DUF3419 family protein [Alphaproteobacteria bacterium]
MLQKPYSSQDIAIAKSKINRFGFYEAPESEFFARFSPAYITSNENLKREVSLTPNAHDVLTIAGSGDQALYYKMAGATHVDTFDISYCARVIQDIKTTAIHQMSYMEYFVLLETLHTSYNVAKIPLISQMSPYLPQDTLNFINDMNGYPMFSRGINPFFSPCLHPTRAEYKKMQLCVPAQFNFIWSDVLSLHTKLSSQYDVINLSNIFSYFENEQITQTIESLKPFLKVSGYIVFCGVYRINPAAGLPDLKTKEYRMAPLSRYKQIITLQKVK